MGDPYVTCLIAVGSNLGDRLANVRAGVDGLADVDGVDIVAVSKLYETAPVGGPDDQGAYYNAAVRIVATVGPAELLAELHRIEASRERLRVVHWGPRTLDLDLLTHGVFVSDEPNLQVPHPHQHERRFVLVPVCDVGPEILHPRLGLSMGDLMAGLPAEPGDLAVVDDDDWHGLTLRGAAPC